MASCKLSTGNFFQLVMALVAATLSSCDNNSTSPGNNQGCTSDPPSLAISSGNGQTGLASSMLPAPIVVVVTGCPNGPDDPPGGMRGISIVWVTQNGGTVNGKSVDTTMTDLTGRTQATWVLGPLTGNQVVHAYATADHFNNNAREVFFQATANSTCPTGGTTHGSALGEFVSTNQSWSGNHIITGPLIFQQGATLTINAGAVVCFQEGSNLQIVDSARLIVRGTGAQPVQFTHGDGAAVTIGFGGNINLNSTLLGSYIGNARFIDLDMTNSVSVGHYPVVIESTLVYGGSVWTSGTGRLAHSTFVGAPVTLIPNLIGTTNLDITVKGVTGQCGINIMGSGGTVNLDGCVVTGNAGDGICTNTFQTEIRIVNCNILENGSLGVDNASTTDNVDARGNWWGDPAGPNGPNGDLTSNGVNSSEPLSAPATVGYRPPE